MTDSAIVFGSSRSDGNTGKLARQIAVHLDAPLFDLADYCISPFDYAYKNRNDDFLPLAEKLLAYDHIVLASPVYWYMASAQMKVFLDRLSDLLDIAKDSGRQLRGKRASVIATGIDQNIDDTFEAAFAKTYRYLGMNYLGNIYCCCREGLALDDHTETVKDYVNLVSRFQ